MRALTTRVLKEGGRKRRGKERAAATAGAPLHPPLDHLPAAAPPLLDPAGLPPPPHPPLHPPTAAGAAVMMVLNARGALQTRAETGRRMKKGVIRMEAVEVEGGTRRKERGRVRREGEGLPGAIESTKIGKKKGAEMPKNSNLSLHVTIQIFNVLHLSS